MNQNQVLETERLVLRMPAAGDAEAIFERYAGNPEVTRYLSWPTHRSVDATRAFVSWSDAEWLRWPAGPYLIFDRDHPARLLGGTGLAFQSRTLAVTGYVLAQDAWGHGYATEALDAMVSLARRIGVKRLLAVCHPKHRASARVLEKCNFLLDEDVHDKFDFPNLKPRKKWPVDVWMLNL